MIFEKAKEYLFKVFFTENEENDFNLFFEKNGMNYVGGFLKPDYKEAYTITKKDDLLGIKIDDDYIFAQNRIKFVNSPLFKSLVENMDESEASSIIDKFKDVEYIQFFESQKGEPAVTSLSYLSNKSSYLLTEYYTVYEDLSRLSVSFISDFFTVQMLSKLNLDVPVNPDFSIFDKNIFMLVSDPMHKLYKMDENGINLDDNKSRKLFLQKIYNDIIDAERSFSTLGKDSKECIETVKTMLIKKFGKSILDER